MKGVLLFVVVLVIPCAAVAQGVRDPSTPNTNLEVGPFGTPNSSSWVRW